MNKIIVNVLVVIAVEVLKKCFGGKQKGVYMNNLIYNPEFEKQKKKEYEIELKILKWIIDFLGNLIKGGK